MIIAVIGQEDWQKNGGRKQRKRLSQFFLPPFFCQLMAREANKRDQTRNGRSLWEFLGEHSGSNKMAGRPGS